MNYKEQEFIARRLEFVLSHEHIKHTSKTYLGDQEAYRNIFSYVRRVALGRYLNLLIENNVLDQDDLEDAFIEVVSVKRKKRLTSDELDQWYKDMERLFRGWVM